jgi:hypothetical protein
MHASFPYKLNQVTLTQSDGEVAYAVGGLFLVTDCAGQTAVKKVAFC